MKHPLIAVLYDGIHNSVFDGQVLQPLILHRQQHPDQPIYLVSFEKKRAQHFTDVKKKLSHYNIQLHILKKLPLVSILSLWPAIWKLKKLLNQFTSYKLHIRGPIAAYIAMHALQKNACTRTTIQARGLLVAEYTYSMHSSKNYFINLWHRYKVKLLDNIEQYAYRIIPQKYTHITIQAVSAALKQHLIQTYNTPADCMTIAHSDIPNNISLVQKTTWRASIRTQLSISNDTHVYCYNGSVKPWQCPEDVLQYFTKQLVTEPNSFLLILTQDIVDFEKLAQQYNLNASSYHICTVPHTKMYEYLSACDTGIIFRKQHIVNWVARPTKILEYQAVGLKIVHNNTVEFLAARSLNSNLSIQN